MFLFEAEIESFIFHFLIPVVIFMLVELTKENLKHTQNL
jgi:hypothetical protein